MFRSPVTTPPPPPPSTISSAASVTSCSRPPSSSTSDSSSTTLLHQWFTILHQRINYTTTAPPLNLKTLLHQAKEDETAAADEDAGPQVAPIVKLEEVAVTTGEEDEDAILDLMNMLMELQVQLEKLKSNSEPGILPLYILCVQGFASLLPSAITIHHSVVRPSPLLCGVGGRCRWRLAENERNQTFTALLKLDPQTSHACYCNKKMDEKKLAMWRCFNFECGACHVLSDAGLAQDVVNKLINYLAERMITAQILQKNAVMQMVDNKIRDLDLNDVAGGDELAFLLRVDMYKKLVNRSFRPLSIRMKIEAQDVVEELTNQRADKHVLMYMYFRRPLNCREAIGHGYQMSTRNFMAFGMLYHIIQICKFSELSVLVDRFVGELSIVYGPLELMLHRRLLYDDGEGVPEALNVTVCVGTDCRRPAGFSFSNSYVNGFAFTNSREILYYNRFVWGGCQVVPVIWSRDVFFASLAFTEQDGNTTSNF
ncbi:hypothetical protein R6Q59_002436 [Mikania micrantha]